MHWSLGLPLLGSSLVLRWLSIDPKALGPHPPGEGRMWTSHHRWARFTIVRFDSLFDLVIDGCDMSLGTENSPLRANTCPHPSGEGRGNWYLRRFQCWYLIPHPSRGEGHWKGPGDNDEPTSLKGEEGLVSGWCVWSAANWGGEGEGNGSGEWMKLNCDELMGDLKLWFPSKIALDVNAQPHNKIIKICTILEVL